MLAAEVNPHLGAALVAYALPRLPAGDDLPAETAVRRAGLAHRLVCRAAPQYQITRKEGADNCELILKYC